MHNFITNSESEQLISKAGPKLRRSSIVTLNKGNSSKFDESRTSEQTWFNEDMSGAAKRITARLDGFLDVEATSTTHSELYQGRKRINYNCISLLLLFKRFVFLETLTESLCLLIL